jgi:hypothetical protein
MDIVVFYWRLVKRSLAIEGRTPPWQGYGVTLPGGFAEYIRVRAVDAEPMPPAVPQRWAALVEPLSCVLHAMDRTGPVRPGDSVLVIGAGPTGLMVSQLLSTAGASVDVVERVEDRKSSRTGIRSSPGRCRCRRARPARGLARRHRGNRFSQRLRGRLNGRPARRPLPCVRGVRTERQSSGVATTSSRVNWPELLGRRSRASARGLAHRVCRRAEPGGQGACLDVLLDDGQRCASAGDGEVGGGDQGWPRIRARTPAAVNSCRTA